MSERLRDTGFMLWSKANLPCIVFELGIAVDDLCRGDLEFDHLGDRGLGQKSDDQEGAVLCAKHHRQRHDLVGVFHDWRREEMRAFRLRAIAHTLARFNEAHR